MNAVLTRMNTALEIASLVLFSAVYAVQCTVSPCFCFALMQVCGTLRAAACLVSRFIPATHTPEEVRRARLIKQVIS